MPNENNIHLASGSKGMSLDTKLKYQPESKASFILNGILESPSGDYPALSNELGTTICLQLPNKYSIIGAKKLDGDEFVIFSTDDIGSEIGIYNEVTCQYRTIVNADCLKFKTNYRIKVEFRIFKGCERVIYFTDTINTYRSMNLDSTKDYFDDNGNFDCSKLELSRSFNIPGILLDRVNDGGGSTPLGTYRFRIRYLDADQNPTPWMLLTAGIPIVDDNLHGDFYKIDGGFNLTSKSDTQGGIPITNKSIDLEIKNLDQSFSFYQLAVLARIDGIGKTLQGYILPSRAITSIDTTYTYIGPNESTDIKTDLTSLTVDPGVIDIVEAHSQIDNRLFLANFSYDKFDYSVFQRAANKITLEWVMDKVPWNNDTVFLASGKFPKAYTEHRTFIADEVYAFGIRGHNKKGWSTPVFHIPGRAEIADPQLKNLGNSNPHIRNKHTSTFQTWDKQLLNVVDRGLLDVDNKNPHAQYNNDTGQVDIWDVKHLSLSPGDAVERWKVYNTAIQQSSQNRGYMAYHESNEDYPNTEDCDGNRIYPTGKIRHHRFPDRTLVGLYTIENEYIHPLATGGTELLDTREVEEQNTFLNILGFRPDLDLFYSSLPQSILDEFQTWEIVVAIRNEADKTVLDGGYLSTGHNAVDKEYDSTSGGVWFDELKIINKLNLLNPIDPIGFTFTLNDKRNDRYSEFRSLKTLFNKQYLNGTYYKHELAFDADYKQDKLFIAPDGGPHLIPELVLNAGIKIFGSQSVGNEIRFLDYSARNHTIPSLLGADFNITFKNRLINQSIYLSDFIPTLAKDYKPIFASQEKSYTLATLASKKVVNRFFNNSIFVSNTEDPIISCPIFLESQTFNFNIFDNSKPYLYTKYAYASIKRIADPYSSLSNLQYRPTNSWYTQYSEKKPQGPLAVPSYKVSFSGDGFITKVATTLKKQSLPYGDDLEKINIDGQYIVGFYESEINGEMRNEASTTESKYIKKNLNLVDTDQLYQHIKLIDITGTTSPYYLTKEYWGYNPDYSGVSDETAFFPLPISYDYCSKCDNRFPFRIRYSEKSFQDQTIDRYKIFYTGNFTDLPGDTLPINNLFVDKNELYAHTPKALYFVPTRQQSLQSNEATIFIGTGEIFAVPPRRLVSLNYAYGGSIDPFATVPTEFGTCFIDSLSGKVFMLQEGLKEISNDGFRNFFENNLGLTLSNQCKKEYGQDYFIKSPTNFNGIGYTATYDTRYRRLILHKRDFEIIDPTLFNFTTRGLLRKDGIHTERLDDPKYFINKSWTLSYSFPHQSWTSFHSYFPDNLWNSESNFFASTASGFIHEHNVGPYQTYYDGIKKDFILELISNPSPLTTKKFEPVTLIHDTQILDPVTNTYLDLYDTTFDRAIFYGSDVSTGLVDIKPQTLFSSVIDPSSIRSERKGREIHLNKISDLVTADVPLFTTDWNLIQNNYYIDKVVNPFAFNNKQSMFNNSRLVDQFMASRLFFKPKENIKMTFESLITQYKPFTR